jgi:hypothetical protein
MFEFILYMFIAAVTAMTIRFLCKYNFTFQKRINLLDNKIQEPIYSTRKKLGCSRKTKC